MDKRKMVGPRVTLLWLLFAIAAILLSFQTMAYAADDSAGSNRSLIVRNWKGEYIGTSQHVLMDPSAGNIVFVIVSIETGQNEEMKEIAVPWVLFSIDRENRALVLSISKKELDSAPEFHDSNLEDPEFVGRIYRFFALGPPWTEETPKAEQMNLEGI